MGVVVMRRGHGGSVQRATPSISIDLGNNITITKLECHRDKYLIWKNFDLLDKAEHKCQVNEQAIQQL